MKSIKFSKKLRLHKETIANLHSKEMTAAHGGREAPPKPIPEITYFECTHTACQTQCPSNDSLPYICCALC